MQLSHITLTGIMAGHAWGGFDAETQFASTFYVRPDEVRAPAGSGVRSDTWLGLDEALQRALDWGDVWGGQGDLVEGWLEFHLIEFSPCGDVIRKAVCRDLEHLAAARPYFQRESVQ